MLASLEEAYLYLFDLDSRAKTLEAANDELKAENVRLEARLEKLEAANAKLEARLDALEAKVGGGARQ